MRLRHVAETIKAELRDGLPVTIQKICPLLKEHVLVIDRLGFSFAIQKIVSIWDIKTPFNEPKDKDGCPIKDNVNYSKWGK